MADKKQYILPKSIIAQLRGDIGRLRGPGFANARTMRNLLDAAVRHSQARNRAESLCAMARGDKARTTLTIEDFRDAVCRVEATRATAALDALHAMEGLPEVKQHVSQLYSRLRINKMRQLSGGKVQPPNLHAVFIGDPGTGKSTVANIYGEILAGAGLLARGEVLHVRRSDLVAGYVGQTERKIDHLMRKAAGSVLVIHDAQELSKSDTDRSDFGAVALAAILEHVKRSGNQLAVVMCGSGPGMEALLKSNRDIERYLPKTFRFARYQAAELQNIFRRQLDQADLKLADDVELGPVVEAFLAQEQTPHGASAASMGKLLEQVRGRLDARLDEELKDLPPDSLPEPDQLFTLRRSDFRTILPALDEPPAPEVAAECEQCA